MPCSSKVTRCDKFELGPKFPSLKMFLHLNPLILSLVIVIDLLDSRITDPDSLVPGRSFHIDISRRRKYTVMTTVAH